MNRTGSDCGPLAKTPCSVGLKPSASRRSGIESSSWFTPVSTSARAGSTPTQKPLCVTSVAVWRMIIWTGGV